MRRDGQFYLIDAFFAAAIVFVGIGFLVSDFVSAPQADQARIASLDVAELLFDTPIYEINNPHILNNYDRFDDFLSPMEQVYVWYELDAPNREVYSEELLSALVRELIPAQHGINISLKTDSYEYVFSRSDVSGQPVLLVNTRRILYSLYEDELYGPELVEVRVWV